MLSCTPGCCCFCCCCCGDTGFSRIHSGKACSSINELADIMPCGGPKLSVLGAPFEAERRPGYASEGPVSLTSERPGRIQPGSILSSMRSADEKLYGGSADLLLLLLLDVPGHSLERRVSNHAGNSGTLASGAT